MPNTGRKNGAGVRIAPPNTRKPKNKDSTGEDGETPPGSEAGAVDQDDADAEEHTAPIDLASFQKQFSTMQKQLAHMMQHMPSTKPRASTEDAAGPASTTSSSTDETQYYHGELLGRLAAVVGNASEDALHDPNFRHTSPTWKANIVKYDKILLERDRNHINTYSCIARLWLHFYDRIQDTHEREAVDEAIELVLDFFADIQARLQYPSAPEIASKISACVRASRLLRSTGLGSIQGIPSAVPELTDMITRLHEKLAEESFRSIYKEGAKTTRSLETEDFDLERKTFTDKIKTLDTERNNLRRENIRLAALCTDNGLDARTKREKDAANQQQKGEYQRRENQRGGQQRTTPSRSSRSDAGRQPDISDAGAPSEDNDLTTQL